MKFGRLVVVDEVEGGIVTHFPVLEDKTTEQVQLAPALEHHRQLFDRPPWLATGDRGVHAPENERFAQDAGVTHLVIPRFGLVSGCARIEGRLSSLRRDYGLRRCPDTPRWSRLGAGEYDFIRHLGWGIIASNLRHTSQYLAA